MEFIITGEESRVQAHTTLFWQNRERSELDARKNQRYRGLMVGDKRFCQRYAPAMRGATLVWEYVLKRSKLCLRHPFRYGKTWCIWQLGLVYPQGFSVLNCFLFLNLVLSLCIFLYYNDKNGNRHRILRCYPQNRYR